MEYVDLNDLGLASYNELIRLKFIEDKDKDLLSTAEKYSVSDKIYEKLGDKFLEQVLQYKDGHLYAIQFKFNDVGIFTYLILIFALAYVNDMDLNNYFNLKIKNKYE